MQKKGVLIGVVALLVLTGIYLAIRPTPQTQLTSAYTLTKVDGLDRIEITPPAASQGAPDLIRLERREDGWWLTAPVEAYVREGLQRELEATLGRTIKADDLTLAPERADDALLGEQQAARLKLFTRGAPAPSVELWVGKQLVIESTRALRTYVKPQGDTKIYRLQGGLGFVREPSIERWRSDGIFKGSGLLTGVTLTRPGQPPLQLKLVDKVWTMEQPDPALRLEETTLGELESALQDLTATGYLDGKKPEEVGLGADAITLAATYGDKTTTFKLAEIPADKPDKEPTWAIQREGLPGLYIISKAVGERLTPTLDRLRTLSIRPIPRASLTRIVYASGVTLAKVGDQWELVAPQKKAALDPAMVDSALIFLSNIRAMRRAPEISAADAGFGPTDKPDVVRLETTTGTIELLLGKVVDPKESHRYAKLRDADDIFLIDKYTTRRLAPAVEEWTTTADAPGGSEL